MSLIHRLSAVALGGVFSSSLLFAAPGTVDLANFSARGVVGGGEDVTILGIVVTGNEHDYRPVLFRGVGPWLGTQGIQSPLSDPAVRLFEGGTLIGENDNWKTGGQSYAIRATGYAPENDAEGAFIAMLTPGLYTMHLIGMNGGGVGLAEAYFIEEQSIPTNLVASGQFTTLVAAVEAAGLLTTLSGPGPFTLFAPTDEAFAALPAGTVPALLADIPTLTNILLYHVVSGQEVRAAQVTAGPVMMANGAPVSISIDEGVLVNESRVLEVDWLGTNGVIHVVDKVILPPPNPTTRTLVQNLVDQGNFTTLVAAVEAAGLVNTLNSAGPFTLFAPTDAAFAKLPPGTVEGLLADIPTLTDILLYHVIVGSQVLASQVTAGTVTMGNGDPATLSTTGGVKINDATVTGADWRSSNGVIHIIDSVILPPAG